MKTLKVHIHFAFKEEPWGGGNQFLKALRGWFVARGEYAEDPAAASAILFNSHHDLDSLVRLKRRLPRAFFIHRVDGPMQVVRGGGPALDRSIFLHNRCLADGTVYQSAWSRARCHALGLPPPGPETVIHNAPDPAIFHPPARREPGPDGRVHLIATSWSTNEKKGWDVYRHLDERLDFSRFAMTFVGQVPVPFRNIRHVPPVPSAQVAEEFRRHDLFLSASMLEACSNAIVEAMNCGLPAVVRNNSSQPELVGDPELVFDGIADVIEVVERAARRLDALRDRRPAQTLEAVGRAYGDFMRSVAGSGKEPKAFGLGALLGLKASNLADRARRRLGAA